MSQKRGMKRPPPLPFSLPNWQRRAESFPEVRESCLHRFSQIEFPESQEWCFSPYWVESQIGGPPTAGDRKGVSFGPVLCTMEVGGALRCQPCPLPPVPFPGVTLTLGRVTAVVKIDWKPMRRGLLGPRRPPDLGGGAGMVASECSTALYLCYAGVGKLPWGSQAECEEQVQAGLCGLVSSLETPKGICEGQTHIWAQACDLIVHRHASMLT